MATVALLVGTRPNIVKISQFRKEFKNYPNHNLIIIHSNQHYSESISSSFFSQFNVKVDTILPQFNGNPSAQIGHIIFHLSNYFTEISADLLIVVGDVNTTLAGAIVANKLNIKLAHLESGLRSFDRSMPEEINRIIVDELADYFFVTEKSGFENLLNEGKNEKHLFFVGNTMIDTLINFQNQIKSQDLPFDCNYSRPLITLTLHRPSNVDSLKGLENIILLLEKLTMFYHVFFPIHPRTLQNLERFNLQSVLNNLKNLTITSPLDYFAFQKLVSISNVVITDSGGLQEETTFLKIPCITLRKNTERPVTIEEGTNILMDFDPEEIVKRISEFTNKEIKIPIYWDGESTKRIVSIINKLV
jgi:UDP-N-acetylglucosamine 2-epimerase (non-hydrolysing)